MESKIWQRLYTHRLLSGMNYNNLLSLDLSDLLMLRGGKLATEIGGWGDDQSYYEDESVKHNDTSSKAIIYNIGNNIALLCTTLYIYPNLHHQ